jgi:hypothetical protein
VVAMFSWDVNLYLYPSERIAEEIMTAREINPTATMFNVL